MRLVIIDNNYPSSTNLYGDVFVHRRVQMYRHAHEVVVLGVDQSMGLRHRAWEFEGVSVEMLPTRIDLHRRIVDMSPDLLLIHFVEPWMFDEIVGQVPTVIWVHGTEVIAWYRRLFEKRTVSNWSKRIVSNTRRQVQLHRRVLEARATSRVHYVFVSQWMKDTAQRDILVRFHPSSVIPNPIDDEFFAFRDRPALIPERVLIVRSFESRKYATDIATRVARALLDEVENLSISVFGAGKHFQEDVRPLLGHPRVRIENRFLNRNELREEFWKHDLLMHPTRQDAQGVTMCEAMATGLVPLTSRVDAIPEFVPEGAGVVADGEEQLFQGALDVLRGDRSYRLMSATAADCIRSAASAATVVNAELELFRLMADS